ncbi:class I SAM-dependent methyltransferase [Pseudomonadota bacterium]|nr:class I SAM-dependent methyltransferase [Pseudomonadota bacterium]
MQWNTFKLTQFDSYTNSPVTEKRLEQAFGQPLSSLSGKRVLEAGSGAGRFTEILLKYGAHVYSFDFSNAVEANYENNMPNEKLTLFQADIENIPFQNNFFDAALCLGVLQHTPSTRSSLQELSRVLKPEGELVCDHYKYHRGMFTSCYLIWWFIIKQFDSERQLQITDWLTGFFFPIHWKFRDNWFAQILLRRISPINFYYPQYDLSKTIHYEWSLLDTHDRNTDHYKRHVTQQGFEKILQSLGYAKYSVFVGGTGYVCRAVKELNDAE